MSDRIDYHVLNLHDKSPKKGRTLTPVLDPLHSGSKRMKIYVKSRPPSPNSPCPNFGLVD